MKKFFSTALVVLLAVIMAVSAIGCADNSNTPKGDPIEYTVSVVYFSQSEDPVSGVMVRATLDGKLVDAQVTDANGTATFNLAPDEYTLEFQNLPVGYATQNASYVTDEYGNGIKVYLVPADGIIKEEAPEDTRYSEGNVMYDFTYTDLFSGEEKTLSEIFENPSIKMVMINFFFTTCSPCAREFPEMVTAYKDFKDSVAIIAIDPLDPADEVLSYARSMGLTFDVSIDTTSKLQPKFNVSNYPTNVIIDRYGIICMIEEGGITDPEIFKEWFRTYTSDNYVPDIGNEFELEKPDIENPSVEDIATAINNGSIDISYRWDDTSEYTWPFVVCEDDPSAIKAPNSKKRGSFAMLISDVTLKKGEILAFEYRVSCETGNDYFYVLMDGEIIFQDSGNSEEYVTCYATAGDGYEHEIAFAYVKNATLNLYDDTVYIKNMHITNDAELKEEGITLDVLRQASNKLNEEDPSNPYYEDYVDVGYNEADGYYHVLDEQGEPNGPYLLADMMGATHMCSGLYAMSLDAVAQYEEHRLDETDPDYILVEYADLIEEYAWLSRYSAYASDSRTLVPVTKELKDALVEIASKIGNATVSDEKEWLESCRYFEQYGVAKAVTDPLAGIAIDYAIPVTALDTAYEVTVNVPKVPRGIYFSFTPEVSGPYRMYTTEMQENDTSGQLEEVALDAYIWQMAYRAGEIFEPQVMESSDNGELILVLDAGTTYYFATDYFMPGTLGTFNFYIEEYTGDYVIRRVAPTYYVSDGGDGSDPYLPQYVDVNVAEDDIYHAYDTNGEDLGLVYIDFERATPFSEASLEKWVTDGMFDWSENGFYANLEENFEKDRADYIKEHGSDEGFLAINSEYYTKYGAYLDGDGGIVDVYSLIPVEMRVDQTETMQKYVAMADDNVNGLAPAYTELVELIKVIRELEGGLTDNSWTQMAFYIVSFN